MAKQPNQPTGNEPSAEVMSENTAASTTAVEQAGGTQSGTTQAGNTQASSDTIQIQQLESQLLKARQSELRALADYQNLVRRSQEDQKRFVKLATQGLIASLLQPLHHLNLAAGQLKDKGLDMVVQQFWQALNAEGLQEINPVGKPFDPLTMEVVDKNGEGDIVIKVNQPGYTLNGEVIQVAKVVVGLPK